MISKSAFGKTKDGQEVSLFHMKNNCGMEISVIDYGCTITSIIVPDKNGAPVDVCLGYDDISQYENNGGYLGAIVGRHANRIKNGEFVLNGKRFKLAVNDGKNHLHGGINGFDKRLFDCEIDNDKLIFTRLSPNNEEGYPGDLQLRITYSLPLDSNTLTINYQAISNEDTVVNLTNHAYYNLNGHDSGSILEHYLQVNADSFTENDEGCLPTGKILPVEGTPFDFKSAKKIGEDIVCEDQQLICGKGYDHNWVLSENSLMKDAAELYSKKSGISLKVATTLPGIQVYTANTLTKRAGKCGAEYSINSGVCLETQFFPNALEYPEFPSPVLLKNEKYQHETTYSFSIK